MSEGNIVHLIDVLSALGTVAGLPTLFRTATTCIGRVVRLSSPPERRLVAILLICLVCLFALQGCAGIAVSESTPSVDRQPPVETPLTIRTLDAEHRFSQLSSAAAADRPHALGLATGLCCRNRGQRRRAGRSLCVSWTYVGRAASRRLHQWHRRTPAAATRARRTKAACCSWPRPTSLRESRSCGTWARSPETAAQTHEPCFATSWWPPPACRACSRRSSFASAGVASPMMRRTLTEPPRCRSSCLRRSYKRRLRQSTAHSVLPCTSSSMVPWATEHERRD